MTGVAIVTDSTSYLSPELVAEHGIRVVPLQVVIDGIAYDESDEATSATVAEALRSGIPVTTSRPSPAAFLDAYEQAAKQGCDGVVSIHLSAEFSGTHESATLAGRDSPVPTRVVDSRSLGMGLGFAAVTAAETAASGEATLDEIVAAAAKRAAASTAVFYVDTLEYLRRGGRIGAGAAFLGSALAVKPLLHVVDGHIEPLEKVRTSVKAIARLEEIAVQHAGDAEVDVAVAHLANPDRARTLADRLRERLPHLGLLQLSEIGAVVGAHVGPGMLSVVVAPR
jgi:DegV family protein with EDD domain